MTSDYSFAVTQMKPTLGGKVSLNTSSPWRVCQGQELTVSVQCRVESQQRNLQWSIKSQKRHMTITASPSDAAKKGTRGYATAHVLDLSENSISMLLTIPVQLSEVPYTITCMDPHTRARKQVTLNFQGELFSIHRLLGEV